METEAAPAVVGTNQSARGRLHLRARRASTPFIGALGNAGGEPGNEHRPLSASHACSRQCPQEGRCRADFISQRANKHFARAHTQTHTQAAHKFGRGTSCKHHAGHFCSYSADRGLRRGLQQRVRHDSQNKSNPGANFASILPDLGQALCGRRWGAAAQHGERSPLGEQAVTGGRR